MYITKRKRVYLFDSDRAYMTNGGRVFVTVVHPIARHFKPYDCRRSPPSTNKARWPRWLVNETACTNSSSSPARRGYNYRASCTGSRGNNNRAIYSAAAAAMCWWTRPPLSAYSVGGGCGGVCWLSPALGRGNHHATRFPRQQSRSTTARCSGRRRACRTTSNLRDRAAYCLTAVCPFRTSGRATCFRRSSRPTDGNPSLLQLLLPSVPLSRRLTRASKVYGRKSPPERLRKSRPRRTMARERCSVRCDNVRQTN